LSNVIKAYAVRYDDGTKRRLESHLRIDKELESRRSLAAQLALSQEGFQEGFVEGLQAVAVETLPEEEAGEELSERASKILEEARAEAERLLEEAKREAEKLKADTLAQASRKGYEEGMLKVKEEARKLQAEYEARYKQLQDEQEEMLNNLEPQMAGIIAALVEKITGILVEDKEEVILNLVSRAIRNMDKSDEYNIRVSKEDFKYISMRKNLLLTAIGREVPLFITEDGDMKKNQCIIETDSKVVNCSLDVQLNNLITDLKLLGSI